MSSITSRINTHSEGRASLASRESTLVLPIVHPDVADTPNTPQTLRELAIKATVYASLNGGKTPGSSLAHLCSPIKTFPYFKYWRNVCIARIINNALAERKPTSHHFDTKLAKEDPSLNVGDLYLFQGAAPDTAVVAMTVNPDVVLSAQDTLHIEGL